jgi:hypothetical protein
MSRRSPAIDFEKASAENVGIQRAHRKNLDYLGVGYTEEGCPRPFLFTTPAMKLIRIAKKDGAIIAKFEVKRKSFIGACRKVIDSAMKKYISENTEVLGVKSKSYIPFVKTDEDGKHIIRIDVTNSVYYNDESIIDEDIDLSSCADKFFRAVLHYQGLRRHGKKYRGDCCASQLKMVQEKFDDKKTDNECGYETEVPAKNND